MTATTFGPGTVKFTISGSSLSFECEVTGGKITHGYEDSEQRTRLCDTVLRGPRRTRANDGLSLDLVNDLTESGLYAFIHANDLRDADVEFIPNLADGAKWDGIVTLTLPSEIGAGAWGDEITSTVDLAAVGTLAFTPAGATRAIEAPADLDRITA